jgi:hypothetical protein
MMRDSYIRPTEHKGWCASWTQSNRMCCAQGVRCQISEEWSGKSVLRSEMTMDTNQDSQRIQTNGIRNLWAAAKIEKRHVCSWKKPKLFGWTCHEFSIVLRPVWIRFPFIGRERCGRDVYNGLNVTGFSLCFTFPELFLAVFVSSDHLDSSVLWIPFIIVSLSTHLPLSSKLCTKSRIVRHPRPNPMNLFWGSDRRCWTWKDDSFSCHLAVRQALIITFHLGSLSFRDFSTKFPHASSC